jgi:phenylalanyl-tRNA synthetase alpha chain
MNLKDANIDALIAAATRACDAVTTVADLEILRRDWLSKEGTLKQLFKQLKDVSAAEKPAVAARLNALRDAVEGGIAAKELSLGNAARQRELASQFLDLSLPGVTTGIGRVHAVTEVERRIAAVLRPFGFTSVQGPEIETEYYCFDALNTPKHHPARDMQDTFYTEHGFMLRTHTTSVQARELQKGRLPVKVASFGRVYRNETEDASHQAMFHQFELVWLEEGLTVANLMAIINHILKAIYGKRTKVRFVPKFYPYTEPSLGPQIECGSCRGVGCALCGRSGWLTVGGSGMIHRNVLLEFGYDPATISGFAFGLGTSRLAAQLLGVPTLKMVYENDLRILKGQL